jgi:hypothetical protein
MKSAALRAHRPRASRALRSINDVSPQSRDLMG